MGILIGMDEAGYGPNYGPLVIAATAWEVPDEGSGFRVQHLGTDKPALTGIQSRTAQAALLTPPSTLPTPHSSAAPDLYRLLRTVVAKKSSERRIAIADSKALYSPGLGLRQLERGLHTVLLALQQSLSCWSAIIEYCEADPDGHHKTACWPDGFDCALPIDAAADELTRLARGFRAPAIPPASDHLSSERDWSFPHSLTTWSPTTAPKARPSPISPSASSAKSWIPSAPQPPAPSPQPSIFAVCDKHGGRNFYAALLQHHFFEHWIEPVHESRAESRYEWGPPDARTRVAFRMNGERFLPTALASMTAKYLRELSMRAFNEFWSAHVRDLRPTAGYPKTRTASAKPSRKSNGN